MNVSLASEQKKFIANLVKQGHYVSSSEVIRDGLRLLYEQKELRALQLKKLKASIEHGMQQVERGEVVSSEWAIKRMKAIEQDMVKQTQLAKRRA